VFGSIVYNHGTSKLHLNALFLSWNEKPYISIFYIDTQIELLKTIPKRRFDIFLLTNWIGQTSLINLSYYLTLGWSYGHMLSCSLGFFQSANSLHILGINCYIFKVILLCVFQFQWKIYYKIKHYVQNHVLFNSEKIVGKSQKYSWK